MSADAPDPSKTLEGLWVQPEATIRETAACMNRNARGIALVVDEGHRLMGTVTDGDIRRAILHGFGLDDGVSRVLELKLAQGIHAPITASTSETEGRLLELMQENSVRHLPLLDETGRVSGLAALQDFIVSSAPPLRAVVMAGGYGRRLHPLTAETPKPMLPIGDKPMLEHVFERLQQSGIRHVMVTTHFRGDIIRNHFGNGERLGLDIDYLDEQEPLGTAGALGLIGDGGPVLVMNADILSAVDFQAMHDFHREHEAKLTIAVRHYEITVPFGVVYCTSEQVSNIEEKPQARFLVNAGIYLVEEEVLRRIRPNTRLDMPDLIKAIISDGVRVVAYPVVEYWLDVGRHDDYHRAQTDHTTRIGDE
jgi:dTDP-glucose pyrophosphorylase